MKSLLTICMLLLAHACTVQAQTPATYDVPNTYKLASKSDYARYNADVINTVNWLENTPINQEQDRRKDAQRFFMEWVAGTPDVSVVLSVEIAPFMTKNPELLLYFIGGWSKYALEHTGDTSKIKAAAAGIKSVIKVYQANPASFKKDKEMKKLEAINDQGKLEEWAGEQFKK